MSNQIRFVREFNVVRAPRRRYRYTVHARSFDVEPYAAGAAGAYVAGRYTLLPRVVSAVFAVR